MKQKNRKLLSRIGAALMLGMSLFNFGAIWNKQQGGQISRRTRNLRHQEREEMDSETQEIAMIAEREANVAMMTEQSQERESQQQLQEESMSGVQSVVRYAAISAWAISATLLFSSSIFNYPFALGKGMLSFLPGIPHVAKISLNTEKEYYKLGQAVPVMAVLNSNNEKVESVKIVINYDSTVLKLNDYFVDQTDFDSLEERAIDHVKGEILLSIRSATGGKVFKNEQIAVFNFDALKKTHNCKVEIDKDSSSVVKYDTRSDNILGDVSASSFKIVD